MDQLWSVFFVQSKGLGQVRQGLFILNQQNTHPLCIDNKQITAYNAKEYQSREGTWGY